VDSKRRIVLVYGLLADVAVCVACNLRVIPRKIRMKRSTPLQSTGVFP
jgi:hypothetical protein